MLKDDGQRGQTMGDTGLAGSHGTGAGFQVTLYLPKLPEASNRASDPVTVESTAGPLQLEEMANGAMLEQWQCKFANQA